MEFVLWEKLAGLEGKELVMLIAAAVVAAALIVLLVCLRKRSAEEAPGKRVDTRALVYGALCISLSFVLSYIKLFSMPMGGSLTLCSMLPIAMYAWAFGPPHLHTAFCRLSRAPGLCIPCSSCWITSSPSPAMAFLPCSRSACRLAWALRALRAMPAR